MNKVVLKAALITVAALAAAGILIFSLWILIAPQSMATVSEKLGNYNFAVTCADLKYKYSGKTENLARCADDSILSGEDRLIVKYCEKLIDRDDFAKLCNRRDEELSRTAYGIYATKYNTYIIGNLAASQYRSGDLKKAVETAERGDEVRCFRNLVIEIRLHGSAEDIANVQEYPSQLAAREYVKQLIELPLTAE